MHCKYIVLFLFMISINIPLLALSRAKLIERLKNFKISPLLEEPQENLFGGRIQRTMTLLSTSNEKQRRTVRILFYGQSIVASPWWVWVEKELRERYPYANLIVENRSIGGYMAPLLVRTAEHDLYPFYPDLVIFHVYGGSTTGELERIYRNIRKYTAGFEIKWSVKSKSIDIWKPNKLKNTTEENSYVLAQGLKNGKHTIEIIPNGDGKIAIKEIRVYSPPLK